MSSLFRESSPKTRATTVMTVLLLAYVLLFFWLACLKWSSLTANSGELAEYNGVMANTRHGKWFFSETLQTNYLGAHLALLYAALLPFYLLAPCYQTLLLAQSLAIGLSGFVFFRIAQRALDNDWQAGAMSLAYLFYPTVATMQLDGFHGETLALPFLMLTVWAYQEERFNLFLLFLVLTLGGQENLPLTCLAFGPLALLHRRKWPWIVAPMVISLAYLGLAMSIIMPWLRAGKNYSAVNYLSDLGATPGEALVNLITHPGMALDRILSSDRLMYLLLMFQPLLLFLPLLSPWFLLFTPNLLLNLVVQESAFRTIPWHYNSTVGACLCVASLMGFQKLRDYWASRWKVKFALGALPLTLVAMSTSSWPLWFSSSQFLRSPYYETQRKALSQVPQGKAVLAPLTLMAQLTNRGPVREMAQYDPRFHNLDTLPREQMYDVDYAILDANERRFAQDVVSRDLVMSFYTNTAFRLLLQENNVFVFQRTGIAGPISTP